MVGVGAVQKRKPPEWGVSKEATGRKCMSKSVAVKAQSVANRPEVAKGKVLGHTQSKRINGRQGIGSNKELAQFPGGGHFRTAAGMVTLQEKGSR